MENIDIIVQHCDEGHLDENREDSLVEKLQVCIKYLYRNNFVPGCFNLTFKFPY